MERSLPGPAIPVVPASGTKRAFRGQEVLVLHRTISLIQSTRPSSSGELFGVGRNFVPFPEQDNRQHRQVRKQHNPSAHFRDALRRVIPAPDAGYPTQSRSERNFSPRSRDEPQAQGVVVPTLWRTSYQKKQDGVFLPIAACCQRQ